MKKLIKYQLENGKIPYDEWFKKLDKSKQKKCIARLECCLHGSFGYHRNLKKGIVELKFNSGERIYLADMQEYLILLLLGGDKTRQTDDIKKAEEYLSDYQRSNAND
jgi:putative addiction module killer protein